MANARQPVNFDRQSARRIASAVRQVERAGFDDDSPRRRVAGDFAETVVGQLTGYNTETKLFGWTEMRPNALGGWSVKTDGRSTFEGHAIALNEGTSAMSVGQRVLLRRIAIPATDDDPAVPRWAIVGQVGWLFPVVVEVDGGDAGDVTTPASYTYTVKDLADVELATSLSPAWARPVGAMNAATHGTAYYVGITLFLWQVDETPQTEVYIPPESGE
jgi:hypothetical protein